MGDRWTIFHFFFFLHFYFLVFIFYLFFMGWAFIWFGRVRRGIIGMDKGKLMNHLVRGGREESGKGKMGGC